MSFKTSVVTGQVLISLVNNAKSFKTRDCFSQLMHYLKAPCDDKVCIVYGLRRTGKTTMLKQAIAELELEQDKCAYIKINSGNDISDIDADLKLLYSHGYKYIFIDEVTLMQDFIDSASIFSDIFVAMGMKIVLSGTDSLGFWLASDQELYDRGITIHTTYIPFSEHCSLLNTLSLDEYIQYGGTLKAGEWDFDDPKLVSGELSFLNEETTRRYIDTAICRNIQNSLAFYEHGGHFRHLYPLYHAGQLTNVINRVIEDMNHAFVQQTVSKKFKSHDFGVACNNNRKAKSPEDRTEFFDDADKEGITSKLMELLSIYNLDTTDAPITDAIMAEVKEYLVALDLVVDIQVETISDSEPYFHVAFTQPGMRFCQAKALVHAMTKDKAFVTASERDKAIAEEQILDEVRGRMMEDIVLLETCKFIPSYKRAFKLQFARGEFDMVIYDKSTNTCEIYEIKHSNQVVSDQYQHLIDIDKCSATERRFGAITKRAVIYTGTTESLDCGVDYLNISDYLKHLSDYPNSTV